MKKRINLIIIILIVLCLIVSTTLLIFVIIPNINRKEEKKKQEELIKNAVIKVELKEDLNIPFGSEAHVSDYIESINGELIKDKEINTESLGKKEISFRYKNDDGIEIPYKFDITVYDDVPPLIWMGGSISVSVGYNGNIADNIMCADNETVKPNCYVEGDYDINTPGKYPVVMKAKDKSGNESSKEFTLNVYEPKPVEENNDPQPQPVNTHRTDIKDIIKKHKKDNVSIGIDVSGWQGEIDYEAVKNAGVEFVFIKVGGEKGIDGEYYVDSKFIRNIEGFNNVGIPVGVYIFSYAKNKQQAHTEALWVIDQIKNYKVDLPLVFDWENWGDFHEFNMSLYDLYASAKEFVKVAQDHGYQGSTYGSKNYLQNAWLGVPGVIWLAHYNDETSYKGHTFWQICDDGLVDGINARVDIDIWYKEVDNNG